VHSSVSTPQNGSVVVVTGCLVGGSVVGVDVGCFVGGCVLLGRKLLDGAGVAVVGFVGDESPAKGFIHSSGSCPNGW